MTLEPFYDESISRIDVQHWPLALENEFLASMLAWERAPILPIYRWFDPELRLPRPSVLSDDDLHEILWTVINKLFEKRIVLDFTDHLSDRELYCLIYRDILPSREKKIESARNYLHWDCAGASAQTTSSDTMKALQPARVSKGPLAGRTREEVMGRLIFTLQRSGPSSQKYLAGVFE